MSEVQAPAARLFRVRMRLSSIDRDFEEVLVMAHSVDLFEGALRFHDWIPLPDESTDDQQKFQQMNRRGFAAGTWVEYEEVTNQTSKSVN